jgi:type IV pilus assembly protein PilN
VILINLLPHREAARKRKRERFMLSLVLSLLVGGLMAGVIHGVQADRIATQRDRNDLLRTEIQRLDTQIKDIADLRQQIAELRARQRAVEDLQTDRNLPVHLLQELVQHLPEGVYLTSLRQDGYTLTLQGVAQSNQRVSELLRQLGHHSTWLTRPELVEIVAAQVNLGPREQRRVANFHLRVRLLRSGESAAPASAPAKT